VLILAVLSVVASYVWWQSRDPRLTQHAAEQALQQRLHTTYRYACKRLENDGSITGIRDVDYLCEPVGHPALNGYFVGTDAHRITGLQPTG
jgi:hypothetical protein